MHGEQNKESSSYTLDGHERDNLIINRSIYKKLLYANHTDLTPLVKLGVNRLTNR